MFEFVLDNVYIRHTGLQSPSQRLSLKYADYVLLWTLKFYGGIGLSEPIVIICVFENALVHALNIAIPDHF